MDEAQLRRAIARKRDGEALEPETWREIVGDVATDRADEAQVAALLMACLLRGLRDDETHALTEAFVASGTRLLAPDPQTVDKHSSGGVADTVSLIVVPLVAACGVPVAKLSGRALGHTGGTLDKLEAIPGVRTDLDPQRFFEVVAQAGCAIAAQGPQFVPADKRIYALRDRTATVPSAGLIAASIVSKKIAGGAHGIVFDVKCGSGAFVPDAPGAHALAATLVTLTRGFGRRARAVVSDMNEPLGRAIGTRLEAIEARDFLRGAPRDARLSLLTFTLAMKMLAVAGIAAEPVTLERALESGAAYERFEAMLSLQGANAGALAALAPDRHVTEVRASRAGYVARFELVALGELVRDLVTRTGPGSGLRVHVRLGDAVARGDVLATLYGDADVMAAVAGTIAIEDSAPISRPLVAYEID